MLVLCQQQSSVQLAHEFLECSFHKFTGHLFLLPLYTSMPLLSITVYMVSRHGGYSSQ